MDWNLNITLPMFIFRSKFKMDDFQFLPTILVNSCLKIEIQKDFVWVGKLALCVGWTIQTKMWKWSGFQWIMVILNRTFFISPNKVFKQSKYSSIKQFNWTSNKPTIFIFYLDIFIEFQCSLSCDWVGWN